MIVLLVCLTILSSLLYLLRNKNGRRKLPPGPPSLPLIGNFHQLRSPLHVSFRKLSKQYGDLMFFRAGFVPTLVVSSADAAREIIKNHDLAFSGRPNLHATSKLNYGNGNMVFSSITDRWREMKKITILEILCTKKINGFQPVRDDEISLLLTDIGASLGQLVDVSQLLHRYANNVLCRATVGTTCEQNSAGFTVEQVLQENQELVASICLSDFFPFMGWLNKVNGFDSRLDKNFHDLERVYNKLIEDHQNAKKSTLEEEEDFIDVLLRLRSENSLITDTFIKAIIIDVFIAGTETSSGTQTWAMTELMRNPAAMKRAQEEVRSAVPKEATRVTGEDLQKLTYLKAVIKEALRVHPPAPLLVPRETTEDVEIRGYHIPAKTRVFINQSAISMDPETWSEPHRFQPERFLEGAIDFRGHHFELIPFGAGRRMCPGMNFALSMVELALANVLHRFDWKLPPGVTAENMNVEEAIGLAVMKKTPLLLIPQLPLN